MTLDERLRAAHDDLTAPEGSAPDSRSFVRARTRRRYGALGMAALLLLAGVALPTALRGDEPATQVFSGDVQDLLLTAGELPGNWQRTSSGDTIAMGEGECAVALDRPYRERADRGFVTPPIDRSSFPADGASFPDLSSLTFLAQRVTRYASVADAESAYDDIADLVDRCRDYDMANPDGGRTRGRLTTFELDLDADDHLGLDGDLVLTDEAGRESPSSARIVVFRVGDALVLLMQANYEEELPPGMEAIAQAALARFRR